jgi:hypothetical protein
MCIFCSLLDLQQLNLKQQRGVRRDVPRREATCAVRVVWRHQQLRRLARLHLQHALIPAADDLADAHVERKGLVVVVRRPEFLPAVGEVSGAVHRDCLPGLRAGATARLLHCTRDAHSERGELENFRKSGSVQICGGNNNAREIIDKQSPQVLQERGKKVEGSLRGVHEGREAKSNPVQSGPRRL